ncbi:unnamed protein product [Sphagnum balticum]
MGLDVIACGLGVLGQFTQLQIHVRHVATTSEFETHGTEIQVLKPRVEVLKPRFYHPSKTALFLVNWCGRPASDHCPHYSLPMLDKFNQS